MCYTKGMIFIMPSLLHINPIRNYTGNRDYEV